MDTSRHWEEFISNVLTKYLQWFRNRCNNVKIKDGCRQPYLSTDRNHFQACTTRSLGEHLGKFLKNLTSGICEDAITRLLQCNDQIAILKIAAVGPYLLTDQNHFRADTSRHWKEFICKVSAKFLLWFWTRCDNGENQSWPPTAILMDRNQFWACTTRSLGKQLGQVSNKSDQWSWRRCDNEKKFTDGWADYGRSLYGLSSTVS